MFDRFTERARQVVMLAQAEARTQKVNYIGPGHILLGLLLEEEGLAARVLASLDVTIDAARYSVISRLAGRERAAEEVEGQIPFTPRAKKALELALREALSLGHNYIGTEHILLGLVRDDAAVEILSGDFGLDAEKIRNEVTRVLSGPAKRQRSVLDQQVRVPSKVSEVAPLLDRLRNTEELLVLLDTAITLARQYPDRPARVIAKAARELHG